MPPLRGWGFVAYAALKGPLFHGWPECFGASRFTKSKSKAADEGVRPTHAQGLAGLGAFY
jgi:hypothetical protein